MDLGIEGKVALVTAGSRGLGRACAEDLAREGCKVAICARTLAEVERTAGEITAETGHEVRAFRTDLSQGEEIARLLEDVGQAVGPPDILVCNAGGPPPGTFESTHLDDFPLGYELTLMSSVRLIKGVVPAMKAKSWGRIILVTSIAVKMPFGNLTLSNVFRSGVTAYMKTAATELAPTGITLNAVMPGIIRTDRVLEIGRKQAEAQGITVEEAIAAMEKNVPMGRIGKPPELSGLVAFLASGRASYITGSSILADGGQYPGLL